MRNHRLEFRPDVGGRSMIKLCKSLNLGWSLEPAICSNTASYVVTMHPACSKRWNKQVSITRLFTLFILKESGVILIQSAHANKIRRISNATTQEQVCLSNSLMWSKWTSASELYPTLKWPFTYGRKLAFKPALNQSSYIQLFSKYSILCEMTRMLIYRWKIKQSYSGTMFYMHTTSTAPLICRIRSLADGLLKFYDLVP